MPPLSIDREALPAFNAQVGLDDAAQARARLQPSRWIVGATLGVVCLGVAHFLITNPRLEWGVVREYLFAKPILDGLLITLWLTTISMAFGIVLGIVIGLGRISSFALVRVPAATYVWIFRGIPPLVQLIFWFNLAYLVPRIGLGVPFGPALQSWSTNDLITPFMAAVLGLTLHEAAYMAEITRAGLLSVDPGQRDAARTLGFTPGQAFRVIVFPQALRVMIPPTGSQVMGMLKGTSLVSAIGVGELLYAAQTVYSRTFQVVPLLLVVCIWYLAVIGLLSIIQSRLEQRYERGFAANKW
jgi:polar amino acid transport system permease protein